MSRRKRDSYAIQKELDKAKKRETVKAEQRQTSPKAYTKRADFETVFYHDPLSKTGKIIKLQANTGALTKIGGLATVGLLATAPANTQPVSVRGLNYPILRIYWFFGDENPSAVTTKWDSRYIKYYDKDGGQSHYSLPFTDETGAGTIDALITKFEGLFGATGSKKSILGARGQARLALGKETLLTINP